MTVGGVCDVCGGGAKKLYTCELCGKTVCEKHYVVEEGICTECVPRRGL